MASSPPWVLQISYRIFDCHLPECCVAAFGEAGNPREKVAAEYMNILKLFYGVLRRNLRLMTSCFIKQKSVTIKVAFLRPLLQWYFICYCSVSFTQGYLHGDCVEHNCVLWPWPGCLLIPVLTPLGPDPRLAMVAQVKIPGGVIAIHFLPGKQQFHWNLYETIALSLSCVYICCVS